MSRSRTFSTLILGCCFMATGCIVDAQEPVPFEAGDLEVPLEETGLGVGNGLWPTAFWNHAVQGTLRDLATGRIVLASGLMPNMPNMVGLPATHWKVIKYTVECALSPTSSVKNPHTGDIYTGIAGLAPGWRVAALDGNGRRWVTACLIQRLNAFGVVVPILIEGNHSAILNDPADDALYPFKESSASGDLFSSTHPLGGNDPAFIADVCAEGDLAGLCRGDSESTLNLRICDTAASLCGLNFLGYCGAACVPNGVYWTCNGNSRTIRAQLQTGECHD